MLSTLANLARWLVWQIREPEPPARTSEARITVISGGRRLVAEPEPGTNPF